MFIIIIKSILFCLLKLHWILKLQNTSNYNYISNCIYKNLCTAGLIKISAVSEFELTPTWYKTLIAVWSCSLFLWKLTLFRWFLWVWWWCSEGYLWKTSKGNLVLTQTSKSTIKTVRPSKYIVIFLNLNGKCNVKLSDINGLRKFLHRRLKCYFDHFTKRTTMLHPRHEWKRSGPSTSTLWRYTSQEGTWVLPNFVR